MMTLYEALKFLKLLNENSTNIDSDAVRALWEKQLKDMVSPSLGEARLASSFSQRFNIPNKRKAAMTLVKAVLSPTVETKAWVEAKLNKLQSSMLNGVGLVNRFKSLTHECSGVQLNTEVVGTLDAETFNALVADVGHGDVENDGDKGGLAAAVGSCCLL